MSKTFQKLREVARQVDNHHESNGGGSDDVSFVPGDFKGTLYRQCRQSEPEDAKPAKRVLCEVQRLEREFLELQEKQKEILVKIKEALDTFA